MLHVPPLPGSPRCRQPLDAIEEFVIYEASVLADAGIDGMMLENFGDTPFYPHRVPPHTVACMAVLAREVKRRFALPLGVNVLRNDGVSALAVAAAAEADFIRVNVYTGARVADQGLLEGEAHQIQRDRQLLGSKVEVWADVAVKHSAALGERSLAEEVEDALRRGLANAIIVSGAATGKPTSLDHVREVKAAAGEAPVLVGSGVTAATIRAALDAADGVIVGTSFKHGGVVSKDRVRELLAAR